MHTFLLALYIFFLPHFCFERWIPFFERRVDGVIIPWRSQKMLKIIPNEFIPIIKESLMQYITDIQNAGMTKNRKELMLQDIEQ